MFRKHACPIPQSPLAALQAGRAEATLTEIFPASGAEAAAAGFVAAQLGHGTAPVLWIQDRGAQRETGHLCLAGLGFRRPLMTMQLSRPVDAMIAIEEGLRCKALAAVVAEIRGDPPAVNFTAMRRLAMRVKAANVPCWLIRQAATAGLSAARDRWRIATLPSAANPDDRRAPGDPRWQVELFRSPSGQTGTWVARHDRGTGREAGGTADRLDLVAAIPDGTLAEGAGPLGQRAGR